MSELPHIRKPGPRRDRRIGARDRTTIASTLCGDPVTAWDVTITDARRALRGRGWPMCPHCLDRLNGREVVR